MLCLLPFLGGGQSLFNNKYKTGYNNVASMCPVALADSGCVVLNYIRDSATSRQDFGLMRLDKNGSEVIKKSFNLFNYQFAVYLAGMKHFINATKNSYFLFGGSSTADNKNISIAAKINRATLDTIKTKLIKDSVYELYINSFVKLNDNKYFLFGNAGDLQNQWPSMLKLDSNLSVLHTNHLSNPNGFGINSAILNPVSKNILLAGYSPGPPNNVNNQPITLMHIDTLGNLLNCVVVSTPTLPNFIGQFFYSPLDNSYVMIGALQTGTYSSLGFLNLCINKYDANTLMPIWQKTYGDGMILNGLYDAVIEPDGSIVAAGAYSPLTSLPLANEDYRGVILKVNKNGDLKWFREYNNLVTPTDSHLYWEQFLGIDKNAEGGYYATGMVMNQPKGRAWVVKTDSLGCVTPGCPNVSVTTSSFAVIATTLSVANATNITGSSDLKTPSFEIKVYPNPVTDYLHYRTESSWRYLTVEILSPDGTPVTQYELLEKNIIDVRNLSSGFYFVKFKSNYQVSKIFKFVKQ